MFALMKKKSVFFQHEYCFARTGLVKRSCFWFLRRVKNLLSVVFYFKGKEVCGRWVEFGEAVAGGKSLLVPANQANQHTPSLQKTFNFLPFFDFGLVN